VPDGGISVLHVLPYPGGGGETYVNHLGRMDGYRTETVYVSNRPGPSPHVLSGALHAQLSGRHFDLLHVHGEIAAGLCIPTLALSRSVVTIHGLHVVRRVEGWRRTMAVANLRLVVRSASRTICVGEAELAEVKSLVGAMKRVVLVRNGVDESPPPTADERTAARSELGIPATAAVGLYLAALDPHKEPMVVARAALEVAGKGVPLVLLFAGDGPLRDQLGSLDRDGAVLQLLGFQTDVRRVLAASDFFILPSRREGLSFALLEAMSAGLPPVVSDAPGNPEAVGEAGIVVPRGDLAGFRDAFERLALDEEDRKRLGERARTRVAEAFSLDSMVERTRQVYNDVLAGHP